MLEFPFSLAPVNFLHSCTFLFSSKVKVVDLFTIYPPPSYTQLVNRSLLRLFHRTKRWAEYKSNLYSRNWILVPLQGKPTIAVDAEDCMDSVAISAPEIP